MAELGFNPYQTVSGSAINPSYCGLETPVVLNITGGGVFLPSFYYLEKDVTADAFELISASNYLASGGVEQFVLSNPDKSYGLYEFWVNGSVQSKYATKITFTLSATQTSNIVWNLEDYKEGDDLTPGLNCWVFWVTQLSDGETPDMMRIPVRGYILFQPL